LRVLLAEGGGEHKEVAMVNQQPTNHSSTTPIGRGIILMESESEWLLLPKFDPRLQVGTSFEHLGLRWVVTWESTEGFGDGTRN